MSTVDAHEHGAGRLLEGRYRLETSLGTEHREPLVVDAYDEESDRAVTLLLLPATSSLRDRLALRLQVRRAAEIEHPGLAPVIDVLDTESTLALVMPLLPGARLLAEGATLPADGPQRLRAALDALHAVGRPHGALDAGAVLVLPDSTVMLLPLPPEPGAVPSEDMLALERLISGYAPHGGEAIPPQRHATSHPAGAHRAPSPARTLPGASLFHETTPRIQSKHGRSWRPVAVRVLIVLCGALGGAALADLLSRLVT